MSTEKVKLGEFASAEIVYTAPLSALPAAHMLGVPLLMSHALSQLKTSKRRRRGRLRHHTCAARVVFHPVRKRKVKDAIAVMGVGLADGAACHPTPLPRLIQLLGRVRTAGGAPAPQASVRRMPIGPYAVTHKSSLAHRHAHTMPATLALARNARSRTGGNRVSFYTFILCLDSDRAAPSSLF